MKTKLIAAIFISFFAFSFHDTQEVNAEQTEFDTFEERIDALDKRIEESNKRLDSGMKIIILILTLVAVIPLTSLVILGGVQDE